MIAALLLTFSLLSAAGVSMTPTSADAAELRTTSPRHFSGGGPRTVGQGFRFGSLKHRTIEVQMVNRGVMAKREEPLTAVAQFRPTLSGLCQSGKIKRFGGGVVTLRGRNYSAGLARDIRGQKPPLDDSIYIFRFEGSTACQVYSLAG